MQSVAKKNLGPREDDDDLHCSTLGPLCWNLQFAHHLQLDDPGLVSGYLFACFWDVAAAAAAVHDDDDDNDDEYRRSSIADERASILAAWI